MPATIPGSPVTIEQIQRYLAGCGVYSGALDGIAGRMTLRAADEVLRPLAWAAAATDGRKLVALEQILFLSRHMPAGQVDGLVGPQTLHCRALWRGRHEGNRAAWTWRDKDEGLAGPASPEAGAWPREAEVEAFFGARGTRQTNLELPFPMVLAWDPSEVVRAVPCHELVAEPLRRIWGRTLDHYGLDQIRTLRLDRFGGSLNVRRKRGGSGWSMHSWGIAWDVDPERNRLEWKRDLASLDSAVYAPFWKIIESQGAVSLGRARNYDWMHFQFARL